MDVRRFSSVLRPAAGLERIIDIGANYGGVALALAQHEPQASSDLGLSSIAFARPNC